MNIPLDSTNISLETVGVFISIIIALIALWFSLQSNRQAQRTSIREATEVIFKEWWGDELRDLRKYFFNEFVPKHRAKLIRKGMKDIDQIIPEDKGRTTQLCYFFDRTGWLGAAGLIDVDYVMGPMQHTMRRTWIVMEPLILRERELRKGSSIAEAQKAGSVQASDADLRFDAVFQFGFEWLFRRSSHPAKHQANLLGYRFHRPRIRTRKDIRELKANIDIDEANFRRELQGALEKAQTEPMLSKSS
jgi:hypothetical protein